jgi:hypothetical protein
MNELIERLHSQIELQGELITVLFSIAKVTTEEQERIRELILSKRNDQYAKEMLERML